MTWLGLDIGGANLKAADGRGWARSVSFSLWREPHHLPEELAEFVASAPVSRRWAVTMTGELCDCFRSKAEGVRAILSAVAKVAGERELRVYFVDGRFASVDEARERPHLAAASNWHALARFAGRFTRGAEAMLLDVGSTTTDVIPLVDNHPAARGTNDTERLLAGELVYTGVSRTPVCAVTRTLPWRGQPCPVAAELFATTADAYVLLGEMAEQPAANWTADGRPLTRLFARERLARMVCADAATFSDKDARHASESVRDVQLAMLLSAVQQVAAGMTAVPQQFVISGAGEFLARRLVERHWPTGRVISLADELGAEASACAPAHALAVLARETEAP